MLAFEEKIVKNSLYSTEKSNYIINMAKVYREFSIQLERNSKINVLNLGHIKHDQIAKQEEKLRKKCEFFLEQFQEYAATEKNFNRTYSAYNLRCNQLDEIILRYRSYENPLSFYNQILTNEYLTELERKYTECSTAETAIITDIQVLDQRRGWMSQHIKEINQFYVVLLHIYLVVIESTINYIVDPRKEDNIEKGKLNLRSSEMDSLENQQMNELQRLDNLYSSEMGVNQKEDNLFEDFSELFRKSFNPSEINSDYKFFYDRCENIRSKKLKTADEMYKLQTTLIVELKTQRENYAGF
jgi:hypothetical protein